LRGFGDLEVVVMDATWRRRTPVTVRELVDELSAARSIAYTTVMTVMDNLHRKGFLDREMIGRAWTYRPSFTRDEYIARLMRDALGDAGDPQAALRHFVSAISEDESQLLRALLRRRPVRRTDP
jgi:predicted transcriptional regulator